MLVVVVVVVVGAVVAVVLGAEVLVLLARCFWKWMKRMTAERAHVML